MCEATAFSCLSGCATGLNIYFDTPYMGTVLMIFRLFAGKKIESGFLAIVLIVVCALPLIFPRDLAWSTKSGAEELGFSLEDVPEVSGLRDRGAQEVTDGMKDPQS